MKNKVLLALGGIVSAVGIAAAQTNATMMKAVVVNEYGGPDVLKYQDAPKPEPKNDEILVRVIAAAVNPVDTYVRQGKLSRGGQMHGPIIIGYDISGVVEKAGVDAKRFKAGDQVY